jgi:ribonuclease J
VDFDRREIVGGPEVATRGWAHQEDSQELREAIVEKVRAAVNAALRDGVTGRAALEKVVRRATGSYVGESTRRRPMIVPVVVAA